MYRSLPSRNGSGDGSLTEKCVSEILRLIRTGQISPGARLGEVALSRKLKMGRAPVRAALDRLANMGVVERIARSGTFVRQVTLDDYCEIIDVRAGLESMAGYLAARRITEDQLAKLEDIAGKIDTLDALEIEQMSREALLEHYDRIFALDVQFHTGIAQACGNRRILSLLEQQYLLERSFIVGMSLPPRGDQKPGVYPRHLEIVTALRGRDPMAARDMILASMMGTKEGALKRLSGYSI